MDTRDTQQAADGSGITRRRFLGYLIAGPTLAAAAHLGLDLADGSSAGAVIPSLPEFPDIYDLTDLLTDAAAPTSHLITVVVNTDGTVSFALPRAEVGQGITTAVAMTIADEMSLPLSKVAVTLADARPELLWNQLTGGSNSMHSIFTPVRVAAAIAQQRLLEAAAIELDADISRLVASGGVITAPSGRSVTYASLAQPAAAEKTSIVEIDLKPPSEFTIVGTPQSRVDALDIVTGRKKFSMDLDVPGAMPTMVCRPPTINGKVVKVRNAPAVLSMPGIRHVVVIPTGVAVVGDTFGQCIDGVRKLDVAWAPGTAGTKSDADVVAELGKAELPFLLSSLPLGKTIDRRFIFTFASNSPLETNCAVADVRSNRAEIWSSLKSPIVAQETIAMALGLPITSVTCHVAQGGGSFGRHLFWDAALEAALVSQKIGHPVKLMWHRADDFRQGRVHPMAISHVRTSYLGSNVLSFELRHTGVATDFSHGLGEILSADFAKLPMGDTLGYSQTVFNLTQNVPYNFGGVDLALNEVDMGFNTASMRNVYSPDVTTAIELMVDQLAGAMHTDAYQFRRQFLRNARLLAVLDKVAHVGQWGRPMAPGTAQGLGLHTEYKSCAAALVEIDCTLATKNRPLPDGIEGVTGPRVTKVVIAVDAGLPINPRGLEAQMMGGAMDAIGRALTQSLHLRNGAFLEASWDNYFYTREWNAPPTLEVIVMPPTTGIPGGAGELGVAPVQAAVACAFARATASIPTTFPINHTGPLAFQPYPYIPSVPASPTDGLSRAY